MNRGEAHPYRGVRCGGALCCALLFLATCASPACAEQVRLPQEVFGSSEQPLFASPQSLAVYQSGPRAGDLLVADLGGNEEQEFSFSGFVSNVDTFTVGNLPGACSAASTEPIVYASNKGTLRGRIVTALEEECGPNFAGFSVGVGIVFQGIFSELPQPLLACTPDTGAGSCEVKRKQTGSPRGIKRYHPDGSPDPFGALGTNMIDGKSGPDETPAPSGLTFKIARESQLAIDESGSPTNGDIYLTEPGVPHRVSVFSEEGVFLGPPLGSAKAEPFQEQVCGAGVDASGHLYVTDSNKGKVYPFAPLANPVSKEDFEEPEFTAAQNPCNAVPGAGPTAGSLFLSEAGVGTGQGRFAKWQNAGREKAWEVQPPGATSEGSRNFALSLDPANGHLFLAAGKAIFEYNASGSSAEEASIESVAKTAANGIAVRGSTDRLYASEVIEGIGRVEVYGPARTLPTVTTTEATEIGPHSATLNGTVNPEGVALTECFFEYGLTSAFGSTAPCEPAAGSIPTGSGPQPVKAAVSGLEINTNYAFRLVAANAGGANPGEPPQAFRTAAVISRKAEPIGGAKTTLNGAVFPEGEAISECLFEWGKGQSGAFEHTAACEPEAALIPADSGEHKVKAQIEGLQPNGSAYHFRLKATGGFGAGGSHTFTGKDLSFTSAETVVTKPATAISSEALTLNGTVNPEEVPITACVFEYEPGEAVPSTYGHTIACEPGPGSITGNTPFAVHADLGSLEAGTTVHYRLSATYEGLEATHGKDEAAKTLGRPQIAAEWADRVLYDEATLKAEINPEGQPTTYRVLYGQGTSLDHSTPEQTLGFEDRQPHIVSVILEGLEPGKSYGYRFIATNPLGQSEGEGHNFTTYAHPVIDTSCANRVLREENSSTSLPDCRAYEMVSPPDKNGGDVSYSRGIMGSSPDGEKLAYASRSSFAGNAANSAYPNHYVATRGASGWSSEGIDPPLELPGLIKLPTTYGVAFFYAYTPDLSSAWLYNGNPTPLSAAAPAGFPNLYRHSPGGGYEPLATGTPPETPNIAGLMQLSGYSKHLSDQVFEYPGELTSDAAPSGNSTDQLYDYAGGALYLVSVLPDGTAAPTGRTLTSFGNGGPELGLFAMHRSVSEDGSRAFWVASAAGSNRYYRSGTVYARLNPSKPESAARDGSGDCEPEPERACTVRLSPGGRSTFVEASADGSRALIDTEGELEVVTNSETGARSAIARLSQSASPGANGGFHNGVLGASDDLSRIYFISQEDLDGGGLAEAGAFNLYAWHDGSYALIGVLDEYDAFGGAPESASESGVLPGPAGVEPKIHSSRVSADGTHVAFTAASPAMAAQVGYDNADRPQGEAAREVYLYDATAAPGRRLTCVSCNPSGARPRADRGRQEGVATPSSLPEPPTSPRAAVLPTEGNSSLNPSRPLSADGRRVLFESYDPLVPADTNGAWDVYQWEAPGKGSCDEGDPDYFPRDSGCISLISTGQSREDSQLIDAEAEGENVFIRTTSGIDPRDEGAYDAYDARVGGGFALPTEAAPCEGEACQNAPAAPAAQTPGTSVFRGPGNIKPSKARCPKGKVRRKVGKGRHRRVRCVKKHRRRNHRHHRRRHHHKGRSAR